MALQFREKDVVGDRVKGFTKFFICVYIRIRYIFETVMSMMKSLDKPVLIICLLMTYTTLDTQDNVTYEYRIIESFNHRLEKTSKIIKSNCQPNMTMTTKTYPEVPHLHVFLKTSRDGDSTTSLGSLLQCLTTHSVKKFFPISNLI